MNTSSALGTLLKAYGVVASFKVKIVPTLIIWELWRSRCAAKYGSETPSKYKSERSILQDLIWLIEQKFGKVKLQASWKSLHTGRNCGADDIIRNSKGKLVVAFSIYLGQGTNNWAENKALQYDLDLTEVEDLQDIIAEVNSKILVTSITGEMKPPWTMLTEVKAVKKEVRRRRIREVLRNVVRFA
ncbi:hypothetical protein RND71_029879 [Anisodus tanguticus]|uniref:RNase H type-1 domain-containing protein n=1 Tax=Anisodus tanguticus TaxID=243964 RepID=A0AAE1REW6_9SOLA|nr:hypothetical protein RND71_029879 [Anisodus tanguticus]